jgi:membrane protein DedA with SNARE-associated domain
MLPTDLASFLELLRQHGDAAYMLISAGAASHSLLLALFAGYAAHSGALSLGTVIMVCWIGSFAGDVARFAIGRWFDPAWLRRFPRLEKAIHVTTRLAARYHVWMILFHRYPHGIRGLAGIAYGMSKLPWPAFLLFNFVAAGLWAGGIASAGYAFGRMSDKVLNDISSGLGAVMLILFLVLSWFLSRNLERIVEDKR